MAEIAEHMRRGLVAAVAVAGKVDPMDEGLAELKKILRSHDLNCRCAVCLAFAGAPTSAEGIVAAWDALDRMKEQAKA